MTAKKVIYSAQMSDYRPVIWYGRPVSDRYSMLYEVLKDGLGVEYAEFLSEPLLNSSKANWLSGYISSGVEFTKLNLDKQEFIRVKLQEMISKIKDYALKLKFSEDPVQKELGELLELAVEVPGLENVIVEDTKIVLVAWGCTSEKSFKENFKLETKIQKPIAPLITLTDAPQQPEKMEDTTDEKNENQTSDSGKTFSENSSENNTVPPEKETSIVVSSQTPPPPKDEPPNKESGSKKGLPSWLWFLLGALVMFLILFFLRNCSGNDTKIIDNKSDGNKQEIIGGGDNKQGIISGDDKQKRDEIIHEILPEDPNVIPPVDESKIITDPEDPGKRKIFSDKVNIAIAKGVNLEDFAISLHQAYGENLKIVYYDTVINLMQVQTPEGEFKQWIETLKKFTNVKLAFSNAIFENGKTRPQDPDFKNQVKSWYFNEVEAYNAWDISEGDSSVIVAIADNGFDLSHPEFQGKIVNPYNVTTGEKSVGLCGGEGNDHGTHVAATALGNSENSKGLCGIAPKCKFMPIQIADSKGNMQSISVVAGILYAIHHNASIVNLSIGTYFDDDVVSLPKNQQLELSETYCTDENIFWNDLFEFALDENVVLVIAAGNQNIVTGIDPFARSEKALIVSAYQKAAKVKADFSNFGKYANISAPGVKIYSSIPGNQFAFMDGTSMASPIVAGAAALMKSKYPEMKAKDIIAALINTAKPLNSTPQIGPLLQIEKALKNPYGGSLLNIPDGSKDIKFAVGKWKSTTSLVNSDNNSIEVNIYFDIKQDGSGLVIYRESDGNEFKAPLEITFADGKLLMNQKQNAVNDKETRFYDPCTYSCTQNPTSGIAGCVAQWAQDNTLTDFNMVKTDF
ncbi:MAG: S8 family serine peptidase [Bacteroidales bacterium]|nr:S8 family serine peptidase [Bacteroidales bacterium]